MKKFRNFRNKKKRLSSKYLLMILSGVCIVTIFTSLVLNISGGPLNAVAGYVFVPMQEGTQINKTKLEQYELDNYRELLELDNQYADFDKIAAHVIAMDGTNWFSTFTIDKGSKQGIAKGMNVIAGSGLVGIVTDVGPNYSKVRSIIDDSSNVSAMVLTTKDNFNVSGSLMNMNKDKVLPFSELRDENDKVQQGDPVVTSYVSDQYQQGLLIGYIYSVEDNANNLTKSGYITPVVDFQHLQDVLVITEIKNTGKEDISSSKTSSTESENSTQN